MGPIPVVVSGHTCLTLTVLSVRGETHPLKDFSEEGFTRFSSGPFTVHFLFRDDEPFVSKRIYLYFSTRYIAIAVVRLSLTSSSIAPSASTFLHPSCSYITLFCGHISIDSSLFGSRFLRDKIIFYLEIDA